MSDVGLAIIRIVVGSLLAGHGSQKLFGWFKGPGLKGMGGWLETMGLRPGSWWAALAGLGEFGGGTLTALGLFHPVGPILTLGPMMVATNTAHAGKPIWVSEGGAELPVTNMAVAVGLSLAGPGRYTLDKAFGIKLPPYLVALAAVGVALSIGLTLASRKSEQKPQAEVPAEGTAEDAEEETRAA